MHIDIFMFSKNKMEFFSHFQQSRLSISITSFKNLKRKQENRVYIVYLTVIK